LLDAGPLVARLNKRDEWNAWASGVLNALTDAFGITETVLAEAAYHLRNGRPALQGLMSMVDHGFLKVFPVVAESPARLAELLAKYPQMDLGDATLVALSERFPKAKLITIDRTDFSVYRRKDGKPVPSIMPPAAR
jgi:predicted nucleic acid-binding protein